ncbi:uncharacterized protein An03g00070 [Aspergillus niger]|uniref:Contig An03c0010, genomic contig n=2 Tax=Aspergillus niger TaxID=5061 RepID=A2QFM5_ASPNC|nr:uncharacterized protein An03g00070 [Aspergillus niger]CAK44561.1 unnamed protein product [Aspergillus niger]
MEFINNQKRRKTGSLPVLRESAGHDGLLVLH